MATSGPGATNLVTGIATAHDGLVPIVCITGQVPRKLIGTDAFQETDITGITLPITKHNYLVHRRAEDIAPAIREAFDIAQDRAGPGPVLVDITKDAQQASASSTGRTPSSAPAGLPRDCRAPRAETREGGRADHAAPSGRSSCRATASSSPAPTQELAAFAEKARHPGRADPARHRRRSRRRHPLNLGMMGMHGEAWVNPPSRKPTCCWPSACASTTA